MKSLMKGCVLSVAMLVLMCGVAGAQECFSAQGSALVPGLNFLYYDSHHYQFADLNLTNITDKRVQCKVSFYDHAGNDITYFGIIYSGGSNAVIVSTGTGDFELPAHSSRIFSLRTSTPIWTLAYAVVEWTSDDPMLRKALIGRTRMWGYGGDGGSFPYQSSTLINTGQPF